MNKYRETNYTSIIHKACCGDYQQKLEKCNINNAKS